MSHMEGMYEAFIQGFPEEMHYMLCTIARPGNYLIVLFLFQRSTPVFCNKPFVSHVCRFLHGFTRIFIVTSVCGEVGNRTGTVVCRSSCGAFPGIPFTDG